MGCLSFENTRKFLSQLWFLFYRFRYLRRRNSYVTFFRESLSLYRWVVFWFSIFNKNNEEGVLRFLWNITENNKTFLHLDRSPYFRERTIRPHLGTKISSKKLSAGRRGWVDDRAKKGKASSPTLVPFPPPLHSENLLASETAASLQQQCIAYRWFFTYFYYALPVPLLSLLNKPLKKKGTLCSNVLLANTKF